MGKWSPRLQLVCPRGVCMYVRVCVCVFVCKIIYICIHQGPAPAHARYLPIPRFAREYMHSGTTTRRARVLLFVPSLCDLSRRIPFDLQDPALKYPQNDAEAGGGVLCVFPRNDYDTGVSHVMLRTYTSTFHPHFDPHIWRPCSRV